MKPIKLPEIFIGKHIGVYMTRSDNDGELKLTITPDLLELASIHDILTKLAFVLADEVDGFLVAQDNCDFPDIWEGEEDRLDIIFPSDEEDEE